MGCTRGSNPSRATSAATTTIAASIGDGQMIHARRVVKISAVHSGMIYTRY
ncbi:MAG: hypothetical protein ACLUE1_05720 [Adlercreutzia equolifaciens]